MSGACQCVIRSLAPGFSWVATSWEAAGNGTRNWWWYIIINNNIERLCSLHEFNWVELTSIQPQCYDSWHCTVFLHIHTSKPTGNVEGWGGGKQLGILRTHTQNHHHVHRDRNINRTLTDLEAQEYSCLNDGAFIYNHIWYIYMPHMQTIPLIYFRKRPVSQNDNSRKASN